MTAERIFQAALNSKPSAAQLAEWSKSTITDKNKQPTSALTGWNGITASFDDVQWSNGYSEPGYSDPSKAILFGNWNHVSRRVCDLLEKAGYSLEWEDEWTTCSECGKAVRTSADSYSWQASFWMPEDSGELICIDCIDPVEYLFDLHNKTRQASTIHNIDPADHGYIKLRGDFENGFHPGQNDDPKTIYKNLRDSGETRPLIFVIDGVGQFDMEFSVWAKQV